MMFRTDSALVPCTPYMRTGGGLVECGALFYGMSGPVETDTGADALVVAASPDKVFGAADTKFATTVYSNATTAAATGGVASFAYAWTDEDASGITIGSPVAATTTFSASVGPGDSATGQFRCTVTDSKGHTASALVDVTLSNFGDGLG